MTLYRVTGRATHVPLTVGVGSTLDLSLTAEDEATLVDAGILRSLAPASIASAATITLPDDPSFAVITGTTDITSVTAGNPGDRVTLQFEDILTFTDGSNLKLSGDMTTSADDTITLVCDGTNWIEEARSTN